MKPLRSCWVGAAFLLQTSASSCFQQVTSSTELGDVHPRLSRSTNTWKTRVRSRRTPSLVQKHQLAAEFTNYPRPLRKNEQMGAVPRTGNVFLSMFWHFGFLASKATSRGLSGCVCIVTDQMVGDRRSPGRQHWEASSCTSSANHRCLARRQVPYIAMPCGRCTRWLDLTCRVRRCGVISHALSRHSLEW